MRLHQNLKFKMLQGTYEESERQSTEKIFANHISSKGLVSTNT